jgi:2-oxoglutarate ferredoxin oxidoreductase subunit beta
MSSNLTKYIRPEVFPTPFCIGCGHGILMGSIIRAIDELNLDIDQMVFVSGIGCAAWIPSPHFAADTLHTTHGRPIAFATGVKLFNPKLKVVIISGDGDLTAIGGNHLIHAARRNIDLTVICANNNIYGMTGGQMAPTTPTGARVSTAPAGAPEPAFDLCKLVRGASGEESGYIARTTVFHARELVKYIKKALSHKGFSFLEAVSPCFTQFGRRNQGESPARMILDLKKMAVRAKKSEEIFRFKQKGKILVGEFGL